MGKHMGFQYLLQQRAAKAQEGFCHAGQGVKTPTLKNHKNIGLLSNTGPDPLKITRYQASIQCRATSEMAFCWWTDDGLLLVVFGFSLPLSTKINFPFLKEGLPNLKQHVHLVCWEHLQRISSDKASNLPKRDVRFILLK